MTGARRAPPAGSGARRGRRPRRRAVEPEARADRRQGGLAVEGLDAVEPVRPGLRIGLQPGVGGLLGGQPVEQDRAHHHVLGRQVEGQILEELVEVRALLAVAGAQVGEDLGPAVVRAEGVVAARQVAHLELGVHRVGLPAEEQDRFLALDGPLDLGEHALLARFDEIEAAQPVLVVLDDPEDRPVAVVARLDPVDLALELALEFLDVVEALETLVVQVLGHREGVFGTREVRPEHLDLLLVEVGLPVGLHRRHPVAEEHVDVLGTERRIGHRDREDLALGRVTHAGQHPGGECRRRRDVGPADIGEAHRLAGGRIGRRRRRGQQ